MKPKQLFAGCFLLLLPMASMASAPPATVPPAERETNQFLAMLEVLQENPAPGQTFRIPESDLNEFITDEVARHRVSAVETVSVRLLEGHFSAEMLVDADQLEFEPTMTGALLQNMLRGKQAVKLEGVVIGKDGMGKYETRRAWLNGVALPPGLVDTMLKTIGKRQDPPFDPTQPFALPAGLQSITLRGGEVVLTT